MADIELVIKIPERDYYLACKYPDALIATYAHYIKKGTPHETVTEFADRCRECGREKMLDKISAKIEQKADEEEKHDRIWANGLRYAIKIIDKYKEKADGK